MSLSQANFNSVNNNHPQQHVYAGDVLEKVIINNDLSSLSSYEKVCYVKNICDSLGLNPLTQPIKLMRFQGKETPYFTKDATEQLRKVNKVSITKIDTKMMDGGIYVVTAYATTPDGRQDSSTGVLSVAGLKGDALGNALMKAETKAKRRVTLSICGLGFIDETEVDSIPGSQKVDISVINDKLAAVNNDSKPILQLADMQQIDLEYSTFLEDINRCENIESLQRLFALVKNSVIKNDKELFNNLIAAKDKKKSELLNIKNDDVGADEEE